MSKIVKDLAYDVLKGNRAKFHLAGAAIVMEEVYVKFPEGDYKRTGNLFNSFESQVDKEENGASLTLFMQPSDDISSYSGGGIYRYYPAYVVEGRFFGNHLDPRPFVNRWHDEVGAMVFDTVKKYIDKTVVRMP